MARGKLTKTYVRPSDSNTNSNIYTQLDLVQFWDWYSKTKVNLTKKYLMPAGNKCQWLARN